MPSLSFTVPGVPIGKGRARHVPLFQCRKCGRKGMQKVCRCGASEQNYLASIPYTPGATKTYEGIVRTFALDAMKAAGVEQPLTGVVQIAVNAFFPIPASRVKKLREDEYHIQRPDLDNILKSIADGCNKVVWADDALVAHISARKFWSNNPRVEVEVSW